MTASIGPTIAIDAMGGDIGLDTTLAAVALIQARHASLKLLLVGDQQQITAHRLYPAINHGNIEIVHASQVVEMDDEPTSVLRHKNDSSMWRAIEMVREGKADACVSAGNTGALMACARYILKMLPGISRPAICATVPGRFSHTHWLDLGANVDAKPQQLGQFAIMGSELSKAVDNNPSPRVGLLNIGEEAIKGNDIVKEAGKILTNAPINYVGFVEGNDIFMKKDLDVVVCDGFVGNVALKTVEGLAKFVQQGIESEFKRNLLTKLCALFALPVLKKLKKVIDPRMYNGATLLGLQGIVVKSHGNADPVAYANAINIARLEVSNGVIEHIRERLNELQFPTTEEKAP